jgi:hypothetical protein
MSFKFEAPPDAVSTAGTLQHADFHYYISQTAHPKGKRETTAEQQPELINVWVAHSHTDQEAAGRALRREQIHNADTNNGQVQKFTGSEEDLRVGGHESLPRWRHESLPSVAFRS